MINWVARGMTPLLTSSLERKQHRDVTAALNGISRKIGLFQESPLVFKVAVVFFYSVGVTAFFLTGNCVLFATVFLTKKLFCHFTIKSLLAQQNQLENRQQELTQELTSLVWRRALAGLFIGGGLIAIGQRMLIIERRDCPLLEDDRGQYMPILDEQRIENFSDLDFSMGDVEKLIPKSVFETSLLWKTLAAVVITSFVTKKLDDWKREVLVLQRPQERRVTVAVDESRKENDAKGEPTHPLTSVVSVVRSPQQLTVDGVAESGSIEEIRCPLLTQFGQSLVAVVIPSFGKKNLDDRPREDLVLQRSQGKRITGAVDESFKENDPQGEGAHPLRRVFTVVMSSQQLFVDRLAQWGSIEEVRRPLTIQFGQALAAGVIPSFVTKKLNDWKREVLVLQRPQERRVTVAVDQSFKENDPQGEGAHPLRRVFTVVMSSQQLFIDLLAKWGSIEEVRRPLTIQFGQALAAGVIPSFVTKKLGGRPREDLVVQRSQGRRRRGSLDESCKETDAKDKLIHLLIRVFSIFMNAQQLSVDGVAEWGSIEELRRPLTIQLGQSLFGAKKVSGRPREDLVLQRSQGRRIRGAIDASLKANDATDKLIYLLRRVFSILISAQQPYIHGLRTWGSIEEVRHPLNTRLPRALSLISNSKFWLPWGNYPRSGVVAFCIHEYINYYFLWRHRNKKSSKPLSIANVQTPVPLDGLPQLTDVSSKPRRRIELNLHKKGMPSLSDLEAYVNERDAGVERPGGHFSPGSDVSQSLLFSELEAYDVKKRKVGDQRGNARSSSSVSQRLSSKHRQDTHQASYSSMRREYVEEWDSDEL